MTTFSNRFNAQRGARRELGNKDAVEGVDFLTVKADGAWTFSLVPLATNEETGKQEPIDLTPETAPPAPSMLADQARDRAEPAKATDYPAPSNVIALRPAKTKPAKAEKPAPAAAEAKPAKAPKAAKPPKYSARATVEQAAAQGILPSAPNFMAETHARYRGKLAAIISMVEAKDIAGLEGLSIPLYSSSPKAMAKYRDLAVIALKAQAAALADGRLMTDITVQENEARTIAKAESFTATKFKGRGVYDRRPAGSLGEARDHAAAMGPGTMIYAITPEGRSTLVETVPHK